MVKVIIFCFIFALSSIPASANDEPLQVPSDTKARYTVLQTKKMEGYALIQTKRVGPSGVSITLRQFNCKQGTFKYLVDFDGDNLDLFQSKVNEILKSKLDNSEMGPVTEGSVTYYAYKRACQ